MLTATNWTFDIVLTTTNDYKLLLPARYYLTTFNTGVFTLKLRLPHHVRCSQCILQWTYTVAVQISTVVQSRYCNL